jgi:hypothetical protein
MKLKTWCAAAVVVLGMGSPSYSAVVFDYTTGPGSSGNCRFDNNCFGLDRVAGQQFDLSSGATLVSAAFDTLIEAQLNAGSSGSVDWGIYSANGTAGLPGTLLASGNATTARSNLGPYAQHAGFYNEYRATFNLPSISLGSGTYWLTLQSQSPNLNEYLIHHNAPGSPSAERSGSTWTYNYAGTNSPVQVALFSGDAVAPVPEPITWALMILGFGSAGAMLRRRRAVA